MKVALHTIFFIIFILPGISFRFGYHILAPHRQSIPADSLIREFVYSIFFSLLFHGFALWFLEANLQYILTEKLTSAPYFLIGSYTIYLTLSTFTIGLLIFVLVFLFRLDTKAEFFRFSDKWYYTFSRCPAISDRKWFWRQWLDEFRMIGIWAVVAINMGEDTYLYRGFVEEYYTDDNNDLTHIELLQPKVQRMGEWSQKKTFFDQEEIDKLEEEVSDFEAIEADPLDDDGPVKTLSERIYIKNDNVISIRVGYIFPKDIDLQVPSPGPLETWTYKIIRKTHQVKADDK